MLCIKLHVGGKVEHPRTHRLNSQTRRERSVGEEFGGGNARYSGRKEADAVSLGRRNRKWRVRTSVKSRNQRPREYSTCFGRKGEISFVSGRPANV